MCICVCSSSYVHVRLCSYECAHLCVHYVCAYESVHLLVLVRVWAHLRMPVHMSIYECVRLGVPVRVRAYACVHFSVQERVCVLAYKPYTWGNYTTILT